MTQPGAPAAAPAPAAAGAPATPAPAGLPTEEQILASFDEKAKAAPVTPPGTPPTTPPAPSDDDPDGDKGFETASKAWQMPEGVKTRLAKLTEQRNKARDEAKLHSEKYKFFEPYADEKGKEHLSTLVEFNTMMEDAFTNNPWLVELVRSVVVEGKGTKAEKAKVMSIINEIAEDAEAAAAAGGEGAGAGNPPKADPRDKQLADLLKWKQGVEDRQRQNAEEAKRREAIDREKETYRSEIAAFHEKNPQFKDDKEFTRLALQVSAARNISFTEAATFMSDYMGRRDKARLQELGKVDQDRGGAAVEQPGRGGVPVKARPPVGSDEEAEAMEAYYSGARTGA